MDDLEKLNSVAKAKRSQLPIENNFNICWVKTINSWYLSWFDKIEYKIKTKIVNCSDKITKDEGYKIIQEFKDSIYEDDILEIKVYDFLNLSDIEKSILKGYKCKMVNWPHVITSQNPYEYGYNDLENISNEYIINR